MKIYVITKGCYSDYHICSVTEDKEKAKILVEKFSDTYDTANIEEYDTEDTNEVLKFKNAYICWYYSESKEIKIGSSGFDYFDKEVISFRDGLYTHVLANTEEDALKIASDKFAKYRAEQQGL